MQWTLIEAMREKLCFIDTPSLEDSQDNVNTIKHILDYVNNRNHLNAVCLLVQPDASRLNNSYQSRFGQLLNRLGATARKKHYFCFTHAHVSFSMPRTTAAVLRAMFASLSMNDISFHRTNTYFFDNESFRYLMAVNNGVKFDNTDQRPKSNRIAE
ncbi:unnamed protein product [Rotaria socialis]|uniref:Uncharacterized protein n=1 Tax=Rotaria socialis TaxID=392032 RepID=A0A820XW90_9BILA|nr:unnamed protein product [Rotaria socialis]CAF3393217.1 unnamed protein product [Rotaria socialis]CAF3436203.1 unnamed protein product [Rotaria socialis]CAF3447510.1 unnamed protein product [Rotaria socialis]CAF3571833.1 unnamed protein product [Rotaria socialis]